MDETTWHEVSDKEREEIKKNAKDILKDFSKKLNAINCDKKHFESSISNNGLREEGECWETEEDFRDLTLLNAPFVEDEFITAEKASWNK